MVKNWYFAALAVLCFTCTGLADDADSGHAAELAAGYQAAFEAMGDFSVTIVYKRGKEIENIGNIRKITALGGTLLVRDTRGKEQVLDATRVIKIVE